MKTLAKDINYFINNSDCKVIKKFNTSAYDLTRN